MSTMSTVTTLAAHNHTLGDDSNLLKSMCVLLLPMGDGTLFDTASIQEEDTVELCVKMEQTHSKGVLQLSVTELVILFRSSEEMLATAHRVTKATAWHEEPIKLHTSPPSTAHLRAYIAGRNGQLSGTQSPTPDREEVP